MVEGDDAIRQSLLMLLSTSPGERVMRPTYGCDLRRLIFAPNDGTTAGLAMHYVTRAIRFWEPRVTLIDVDATPSDEDEGRLDIRVVYRVRRSGQVHELLYAFGLGGTS